MAGLMQPTAAPAPAAPAPAPAGLDAAAQPQGQQQASPEEQQLHDELVARGVMLLLDEKTNDFRPGVREAIADADDPAAGLGEAVGTVVGRIDDQAAKDGIQIPPDVREAAGVAIFELAAAVASRKGIHDFENDDEAFQRAFLIGVDTVRQQDVAAGRMDPEKAKADFAAMAQADQAGQLGAMLGGQA